MFQRQANFGARTCRDFICYVWFLVVCMRLLVIVIIYKQNARKMWCHTCFSNIFAFALILREIIINGTLMVSLLFCTVPNFLRFYYILITGRSGDRIPLGARFSTLVQTGPRTLHNGYRVFPGGRAAGAWRWPPTPFCAEVKERVELYLYSLSGPSWPALGQTLLNLYYLRRGITF